ncbi:MAG: STAS domain-containing protein [Phycisphaerae bacterium]
MSKNSNNLVKDVHKTSDSTIVILDGEVDMRRSPDLHAALVDVANDRPKKLILNLSAVPYMDSSGVGTLVEVYRRVSGYEGKFILFGLTHRVRSVFEITKLDRFFTICETEEEAARA